MDHTRASTRPARLVAARLRLRKAAQAFYVDPSAFLDAFVSDPFQAILTLRDSPDSFGRIRTYLGPLQVPHQQAQCLAAARAHYRLTAGSVAVNKTRRRRSPRH